MDSLTLPFPEYRPDVFDRNAKLTRFLQNAVPRGDGFGPWFDLTRYTALLPSACRGAYLSRSLTDGTLRLFAGTATKLYLLDNTLLTWTDVSKSGGTYGSLDADAVWSFAQFGNRVIASQRNDVMQSFVIGSSSAFANLAGSPPQAGFISVFGSFLFACDILSSPNRVQWCSIGNPTSWTGSLADFQDMPDGGRVRRVVEASNLVGFIVQEQAVRRLVYSAGSDTTFQIEKLRTDLGILAPNSLVTSGGAAYFASTKGFVQLALDGSANFIGEERVDRTFLGRHTSQAPQDVRNLACDPSALGLVFASADPARNLIMWAYKTVDGTTGLVNKALLYHVSGSKWGIVTISAEYVMTAARPGLTLEALDAIAPGAQTITGAANNGSGKVRLTVGATSGWTTGDTKTISGVGGTTEANGTWQITVIDGTHIDLPAVSYANAYTSGGIVGGSIDLLSFSLDSVATASLPGLAAFDSSHGLGFYEGSALEALIYTTERELSGGEVIEVNNVRPMTDADAAYCCTITRDTYRGEATVNTESEMDDHGDCPVLDAGFLVRARLRIPAGAAWNFASGVTIEAGSGAEQ